MLIRKLANSYKTVDVDVDIEVKFTADSGSSTIIPLSKKWKSLGIQLSGGLDSALLLFLSAKAIQEQNLNIKIQPISIFIPTKAKNIVATNSIIQKVREITGADFIKDGLGYNMPLDKTSHIGGKKDKFFKDTIRELLHNKKIDFEFNGNTKNPPEEIRKNFKHDLYRQRNRDNAQSIYTGGRHASPHYHMNKSDIINLYIKYGLIDTLSALTVSCDEDIDIVHENQFTVPCKQCWWCQERAWGFDSNNVEDLAPILTYEEYIRL